MKPIRLVPFAAAVFYALAAPNCANSSNNPGGDSGGPDVVVGPCGPGSYSKCGSTCVNEQSDYQNCGKCGNQCASGLVCSHGACTAVCGGSTTHCGNDCIDPGSDVNNCGGCGKQCPPGNVCSKGSCALTCQTGLTNCAGDCVDVTQDDDNCGGCGSPCAGGQVCVASQCVATCQSGWVSCPAGDSGTTCVDPKNDPNNCNGCGKTCPQGYFCVSGACSVTCGGGTSQCGTGLSAICVDESIDPNHCGSCTTVCGTGNVCSGAHCCGTATPYYCGKCDTYADCVTTNGGYIMAGYDTTCAINRSGAVLCWGDNGSGQAGTNDSTTYSYDTAQQVVGLTSGIVSLGAGESTSFAVRSGALLGWGDDSYGELGDGAPSTQQYAPVSSGVTSGGTRVAGTYDATCVIQSGAVLCMGYDGNYEIPNGATLTYLNKTTPTTTLITNKASTIGAGEDGTMLCASLTDGTVQCWGTPPFGTSLGDGTTTTGTNTPVTVTGISTAVSVAVSSTHACILLSTGALECWGDDYYGELGDGGPGDAGTSQSAPVAATLTGVARVAVGDYFTCALTTAGAVECVGYNSNGQLGNGTTSFTATSTWQTPISSGAIDITAGYAHACALMSDGSAKCWGANYNGQLGNGTMTDSSSPVTVTGF